MARMCGQSSRRFCSRRRAKPSLRASTKETNGKFPYATIFYAGDEGGCHRGLPRAGSMPATISASSAASIGTAGQSPISGASTPTWQQAT